MTAEVFPEVGYQGFPWLFALALGGVVVALLWTTRGRFRAAMRGEIATRGGRVAYVALWLCLIALALESLWDPIAKGRTYGASADVQQFQGGRIHCFDLGNPCSPSGPLYRIKVDPGQRFSVLTSLVNKGPLPITLLGPSRDQVSSATPGVAWYLAEIWSVREPSLDVFPSQAQLERFRPASLLPGEQTEFVLVLEAGACADADGVENRGTDLSYSITGFNFVYEFALWRRVGPLFPQFEIAIPVDSRCMAQSATGDQRVTIARSGASKNGGR